MTDGNHGWAIDKNPENIAQMLQDSTKQLGPTYVSKVLRFALPVHFGAIDTRCVRMFGEDSDHRWVSLKVVDYGYGPYIETASSRWPRGYGTWINILRYFAHHLPTNCPHPQNFVDSGLRTKGVWTCADVEMALFAYASSITNP